MPRSPSSEPLSPAKTTTVRPAMPRASISSRRRELDVAGAPTRALRDGARLARAVRRLVADDEQEGLVPMAAQELDGVVGRHVVDPAARRLRCACDVEGLVQ